MRLAFTANGRDDHVSWTDDRRTLKRINRLIKEAARNPAAEPASPSGSAATPPASGAAGSIRNTGSSTP